MHDLLELCRGDLQEFIKDLLPGVIDQSVNTPPPGKDLAHNGTHGVMIAHVNLPLCRSPSPKINSFAEYWISGRSST